MWNLIGLSILISFLSGCASTERVGNLQQKLNLVHMQNMKQQTQIKELQSNQEALKGELSDLNAKFDRMYSKNKYNIR